MHQNPLKTSQYDDQNDEAVPFDNVEEAWFWFIAAQEAKNDGAKFVAGAGLYQRPCEPLDILKVVDRLYRNRILQRDHLMVLRHYGQRNMAPDLYREKEVRAYHLWRDAMEHIEAILIRKGIVAQSIPCNVPAGYICDAMMSQRGMA